MLASDLVKKENIRRDSQSRVVIYDTKRIWINFGKFFKEHDKRRGTDFCKTFPELADFYNDCLEIKL